MTDDVLQIGGVGSGAGALPWHAFTLSAEGDTLLLGAYDAGRRDALAFDIRLTPAPGEGPATDFARFDDVAWPMGRNPKGVKLTRLIAGSTAYDVAVDVNPDHSARILLRAREHAPLFDEHTCANESAARCPHPFDVDCVNPGPCSASAMFSGGEPSVFRAVRDGAELTWRWRIPSNALADSRNLEPLLDSRLVASVRAALIGLALLLGVAWTAPSAAFRVWLAGSATLAVIAAHTMPAHDLALSDRPATGVLIATAAAFVTALWRLRANLVGALRLFAVACSCALAFANEIAHFQHFATGADFSPVTTFQAFLANWLLASLALTCCEAGVPLALLWVAMTILCALGTFNLAEMALNASTDKFLFISLKYRLLFLDLLPPLVVAAAVATPAALSRNLEAFAANEAVGLRARWIGVLSLFAAIVATVRYASAGSTGSRLRDAGRAERGLAARELRGLGFTLLQAAAALLLVGAMGLWLSRGSQLGLDEFQPVEFAKFAVVILCARTLLQMLAKAADVSTRRSLATTLVDWACLSGCAVLLLLPAYLAYRQDLDIASIAFFAPWLVALLLFVAILAWRELLAIAMNVTILALFLGTMLTVPAAQSDWSPALIMGGVTLAMGLAFLVCIGAQTGVSTLARRVARRRTPRRFIATPRGEWSGFAAWCVVIAGLAVATAALHWTGRIDALAPLQTAYVSATRMGPWTASAEERLDALETEGLMQGRRVVVERFLALEDMRLGARTSVRCALEPANAEPRMRPCYADSEMQLILSRSAVASAPCGFPDSIAPQFFPLRDLARAAAWLAASVTPCDRSRAAPGTGPAAIQPIEIPVAESDFAGAYLLARLGIGAGLIAFAAQALLLAVPMHQCAGLFRLGFEPGPRRATARLLMATVAGCVCLFAMQWAMSWANVLGLWPVMGQPMTLLSNATSHHLLMVIPALMTFILALRYAKLSPFVYRPRDPP